MGRVSSTDGEVGMCKGFEGRGKCETKVPLRRPWRKWKPNTVMRRIPTFRSTTDRIYDGGLIIL